MASPPPPEEAVNLGTTSTTAARVVDPAQSPEPVLNVTTYPSSPGSGSGEATRKESQPLEASDSQPLERNAPLSKAEPRVSGKLVTGAPLKVGRGDIIYKDGVGTHNKPKTSASNTSLASVGDHTYADGCCQLSSTESEPEPPSPWMDESVDTSDQGIAGFSSPLIPELPSFPQEGTMVVVNTTRHCNSVKDVPESALILRNFPTIAEQCLTEDATVPSSTAVDLRGEISSDPDAI